MWLFKIFQYYLISGICRGVNQVFATLIGCQLMMFRDSLSFQSSRVSQTEGSWLLTFLYSLLVETSGLRQSKGRQLPTLRNSLSVQSSGLKQFKDEYLPTFRNSLSVQSSGLKQSKDEQLPKFRNSLSVLSSGPKQSNGSYRRFGTIYRSILQSSSSPLVVTDVSEPSICLLFRAQAVHWQLPTFRKHLSVYSSELKQSIVVTDVSEPSIGIFFRAQAVHWQLPMFRNHLFVYSSELKQSIGSYRCFGTIYLSILQSSSSPLVVTDVSEQSIGFSWSARSWNIGLKGCTAASVINHQSALPNIS